MNYLEYFGLSQEPFTNAPVSKFYYNSPLHTEAISRLSYAVESMKGLALLVGQIGSGKTTLARRLLDSLPESQYEAALLVIIHSGITATWLLRRIALQLGVVSPHTEKLALLGQLYQRLVQIQQQGKRAVVLIDEAQMLQSRELMEELRGLLNLEMVEKKLLTLILFGLPELEQNLLLDPPLAQRVAIKVQLKPFDRTATEAYIKHRLRLAGAQRMLFDAAAVNAIFQHSLGVPRIINTLCDNALLEAAIDRINVVNEPLVTQVADNLRLLRVASQEAQQAANQRWVRNEVPSVDKRRRLDLQTVDAMLHNLQRTTERAPERTPDAAADRNNERVTEKPLEKSQ